MKVGIIIQARLTSTRLPGKITKLIAGKTLLNWVLDYCKSTSADAVILAVPDSQVKDFAVLLKDSPGVDLFGGSEMNVYQRFVDAAYEHKLDYVVRITSDDPFKSPYMLDSMINLSRLNYFDYISNNLSEIFPYGYDVEAFSLAALLKSANKELSPLTKEHVTSALRNSEDFRRLWLDSNVDLTSCHSTVDTQEDLNIANSLASEGDTSLINIIKFFD